MNKLFSLAFILSLTTPIFTLDAHADDQNMGNCSMPVRVGLKNSDYYPVIFDQNNNRFIYVTRIMSNSGIVQSIEISPGSDGRFGTGDEVERIVPDRVTEIWGNVALARHGYNISSRPLKIINAGPDSRLFTADDSVRNLSWVRQLSLQESMLNGDLLIYQDRQFQIRACDHTFSSGAGSCSDSSSWVVPTCTYLGCMSNELDVARTTVLNQKVNGTVEPIVLWSYDNGKFAVILLNSGAIFPLPTFTTMSASDNLYSFGAKGNILHLDYENTNTGERNFEIVNLDYSSPFFLTSQIKQSMGILGGTMLVSNSDSSDDVNLPPYVFRDPNAGLVFRDDALNKSNLISGTHGNYFYPTAMNGSLVVGTNYNLRNSVPNFSVSVVDCN